MSYFIVQLVCFVFGVIANIYWRADEFECESREKAKRNSLIRWLVNNRCDVLFTVFFLAELVFLLNFSVSSSVVSMSILMFADAALRVTTISIGYAFVLNKKRFFFVLFILLLVVFPIWLSYFSSAESSITSYAEFTLSIVVVMLLVYNIRFVFHSKTEESYTGIISLYKQIIGFLCLEKHD